MQKPPQAAWVVFAKSSNIAVRDVHPQLTEHEVEEIVWRKIRSLQVAANGPNRYDRTLMALRRLVATATNGGGC